MTGKCVKYAWITSLPVLAGYLVLGIGFGILLQQNGYGPLWALAMSVCIYAGSMQYVGVSLLASGATILTTALTTVMVNARHLFYGISMIETYKEAGPYKPYLIFALTDETYSLVVDGKVPEGCDPHQFHFLVSLFDQVYWVAGSVLGALLGQVIPFSLAGIEFSMTALFLTVFVEQWISRKDHIPALIGVGATISCRILFGREQFLIPAMLLITLLLTLFRKRLTDAAAEKAEATPEEAGEQQGGST